MTDNPQPTDPDRDDAEQVEQPEGAPSTLIEDVEPVGGDN